MYGTMIGMYSHKEYANMLFSYGFCNGKECAAVQEFRGYIYISGIADVEVMFDMVQHLPRILRDRSNPLEEYDSIDFKFLKKLNRQERVVEEVKLSLKPHYTKKHITKEEYKDILRRSVPKICHNKSGEINPIKISCLVEAYVKKYRYAKKKNASAGKTKITCVRIKFKYGNCNPRNIVRNKVCQRKDDIASGPHLWSNGQRVWLRNQVARVRILVGASYLVDFFRGFPSTQYEQMLGNFRCWTPDLFHRHYHLHIIQTLNNLDVDTAS
ncbi:hypothetical protein ANN_13573 [Periplaneta americana]|uniref:SFR19-like C-terminal domain-containing protein n=1 Tax=Periplaneta americana TaxID=6978 RepID=A0ABQ8TKR7_PERAM|nr:hypothetical protein ANN_13573 [Periplaneta americana]